MKENKIDFGLTRFLSWVSLVLILASSLILAIFIGNSARSTLLIRQQEYALLLVENLNYQIYRRFTLPTYLTFGRIALRQEKQFELLDEVVQSTIIGLQIDSLRIYGTDYMINYSLDLRELGLSETVHAAISDVMNSGIPTFETISDLSWYEAFFTPSLPPKSYTLRTVFPLRVDLQFRERVEDEDSVITGVLEISQDITDGYNTALRFQRLILATSLGSAIVLFGFLQFFISRSEKTLAERMARNQKLEHQLHQSEKLASMGRVIASIAHEIRNPLGIIRSTAELLLRRSEDKDKANTQLLTAVYDESCRLSQTVNDFLDYARPRVPRQDVVDIAFVLEQLLGFLEGECARFHVTVLRDIVLPVEVKGDKDLLYRALYNVMSNALQAMEEGGTLQITARRAIPEKVPEGVVVQDFVVEVSFYDSGPGFDETTLPHLLDPFFTTKHNGTGLGLPIVNTIIASHGGWMELKNAQEGGAMVTLFMPTV